MEKTSAFLLSSHVFGGSYQVGIPMLSTFRSMLHSNRLQILTMEVTAQSMHEQLRVELGTFEKFQRIRLFEIDPKLGKVAVIR